MTRESDWVCASVEVFAIGRALEQLDELQKIAIAAGTARDLTAFSISTQYQLQCGGRKRKSNERGSLMRSMVTARA